LLSFLSCLIDRHHRHRPWHRLPRPNPVHPTVWPPVTRHRPPGPG